MQQRFWSDQGLVGCACGVDVVLDDFETGLDRYTNTNASVTPKPFVTWIEWRETLELQGLGWADLA